MDNPTEDQIKAGEVIHKYRLALQDANLALASCTTREEAVAAVGELVFASTMIASKICTFEEVTAINMSNVRRVAQGAARETLPGASELEHLLNQARDEIVATLTDVSDARGNNPTPGT